MPVKNFLKTEVRRTPCHDGEGIARISTVFGGNELSTPLQFVHYTILPPKATIGLHTHGDDEELYVILSGSGSADIDGKRVEVRHGDVILNKPFGTHALYNTSESEELKILVIKILNQEGPTCQV